MTPYDCFYPPHVDVHVCFQAFPLPATGWISLLDLEDGHRWARRQEAPGLGHRFMRPGPAGHGGEFVEAALLLGHVAVANSALCTKTFVSFKASSGAS